MVSAAHTMKSSDKNEVVLLPKPMMSQTSRPEITFSTWLITLIITRELWMDLTHFMAWVSLAQSSQPKKLSPIPRISVTSEDLLAVGRINIKHRSSTCTGLHSLVNEKLCIPTHHDPVVHSLDALWNLSLHLQTPRPFWSGMMQAVYDGPHPGTASVMFLPMIDLNPGNMTCIYSIFPSSVTTQNGTILYQWWLSTNHFGGRP